MGALLATGARLTAVLRPPSGQLDAAQLETWLPTLRALGRLACAYNSWLHAQRDRWSVACRRRVPAALYACERLQLGLVTLLQAPPRPAAAAAAEAARLALLLQLRARAPSGDERPVTPTEESGAPPPPLARPAASRRGMRSRNAFIDSELASGQYDDSFADLEDFIVCKRGRQY